MRPLQRQDGEYFWVGNGLPTVITGVPSGAIYFDQTGGLSYSFIPQVGWRQGGFVALPITDPGVAGEPWNNGGFICISEG